MDEETTLSPEELAALDAAEEQLQLAINSINAVDDESDFNVDNLNDAKTYMSNGFNILKKDTDGTVLTGVTTQYTNDDDETSEVGISERGISSDMNKLRKWQFEAFEEEFSAEIYTDSYHQYYYTETIEELCEKLNTVIKSLGADIDLDPEHYSVSGTEVVREGDEGSTINIEQDIKDALTSSDVSYIRIDIDWHDKEFDGDN